MDQPHEAPPPPRRSLLPRRSHTARRRHLPTTVVSDATVAEGDEEEGWAGGEEAGCGALPSASADGPAHLNAPLTTRLRFAAAAVRAEEAGAAGAGVMTLADRSRGSVAQARHAA